MKYKIKYEIKGNLETYIAMATPLIALLQGKLYDAAELHTVLQAIVEEVKIMAEHVRKGGKANPAFEIEGDHEPTLQVMNTTGRVILVAYFERIYDKGQKPEMRRL